MPPRRGRPGVQVPCSDCDEVFYRRCDLRIHRKEVHLTHRNCCRICGRSFSSERRLNNHIKCHNEGGEYQCVYCLKEFNKGWKLKIHLVNHNGKPPFYCQYCKEDFLYPGKILDHLKLEHNVFIACKDCGIGFITMLDHDNHKCKLYACKDCSLSFCTFGELSDHSKTHPKVEPMSPPDIKSFFQISNTNETSNEETSVNKQVLCKVVYSSPEQSVNVKTCMSKNEITNENINLNVNSKEIPETNSCQSVYLTHQKADQIANENINVKFNIKKASEKQSSKFKVTLGSKKNCNLNVKENASSLTMDDVKHTKKSKDNVDHTKIGINKVCELNGINESANSSHVRHSNSNSNKFIPKDIVKKEIEDDSEVLPYLPLPCEFTNGNSNCKAEINIKEEIDSSISDSLDKQNKDNKIDSNASDSVDKVNKDKDVTTNRFKVPDSNWNIKKRINGKSIGHNRNKRENPSYNDQGDTSNSEEKSFKVWLTSGNTQYKSNDFVFGVDGKEPLINQSGYSTKLSKTAMKKEESHMSFEDLCSF